MSAYLLLKFGALKQWSNIPDNLTPLIKEYLEAGDTAWLIHEMRSVDKMTDKRKAVLCKLIDAIDGKIQEDWDGKILTKQEAKDYINNYGVTKND